VPDAVRRRSLPRSLVLLFAVACGLAVANVYYAQPVLDAIAADVGLNEAAAGAVVGVTQVGYGLGLILLVPLGDMVDRRRLVVTMLGLSTVALVGVAAAPSTAVLFAALAGVGVLAVVVQVLVAFAASLAEPERRGEVVGTVTSGVVVGILLSRTLAGGITELAGWRAVYLTSAVLVATVAALLWRALPGRVAREDRAPAAPRGYGALLRSVAALYRHEPVLRQRATLALLIFATFSTLWTSLVLPLSEPPLSLSHGTIGLFGLVGAAGALAAVRAGRLADRGHAHATTGVALALMLASWLPIGLTRQSLMALVIGLVLLDLAVQAVHVTSQTMIYAIDPDARSRLVAAYMVFYSVGTAAGSVASTATYAWAGWAGVCVLGAAFSAAALAFWAWSRAKACQLAWPWAVERRRPCDERRGVTHRGGHPEPAG
jgi:predicted MFS family arabinose efflux permease